MPVANCIITSKCQKVSDCSGDLIELWAGESKMSSEHMTINILTSDEQLGNQYAIMANLLLPSIWSSSDISSLQLGLARALSIYFNVSSKEVFVSTGILDSGLVVEAGKEVKW